MKDTLWQRLLTTLTGHSPVAEAPGKNQIDDPETDDEETDDNDEIEPFDEDSLDDDEDELEDEEEPLEDDAEDQADDSMEQIEWSPGRHDLRR